LLSLLALCLVLALPAVAQGGDAYDNGPVNGQVDAWTINFGFSVSDTITCCKVLGNGPPVGGTITGLDFWAWLIPGDTITSVEVQLGSSAFGNNLFDGTVNLTQSGCFANNFGYNVCMETGNFSGPSLGAGNYWLTLQNAVVPSGDPVYWDENSGVGCTSPGCPSQAQENTVGTIPSEAFTLLDNGGTTTTTTGTTPEPGSILLLGTGAFGLAGIISRKIRQ
jgi:hypothetical protein